MFLLSNGNISPLFPILQRVDADQIMHFVWIKI